MYSFLAKLFDFNDPLGSTWKYTLFNLAFCFVISLIGIVLIWFANTPFIDFKGIFAALIQDIIIYKLPLFMLVILFFMVFAIFTRKTALGVICAFTAKLVTTSYMVSLMTNALGTFIIKSDWIGGEWENHLPYSAGYPFYSLSFTIILWSGLWYTTLFLRLHVKNIYESNGKNHLDMFDKLGVFLTSKA